MPCACSSDWAPLAPPDPGRPARGLRPSRYIPFHGRTAVSRRAAPAPATVDRRSRNAAPARTRAGLLSLPARRIRKATCASCGTEHRPGSRHHRSAAGPRPVRWTGAPTTARCAAAGPPRPPSPRREPAPPGQPEKQGHTAEPVRPATSRSCLAPERASPRPCCGSPGSLNLVTNPRPCHRRRGLGVRRGTCCTTSQTQ